MSTKAAGGSKKLSSLSAWAFSFACAVGWAAFVMPATVFLPRGGILGSVLAFLLGTIAMGVIAMNYHFLGNTFSGQGGIYNLVLVSMNRTSAFIATWGLGLAYLCCICLNAKAMAMLCRSIIEETLTWDFNVYFLESDTLFIEAAIVLLSLIFFAVINIRGIKHTARVQTVGAIALLAGIVIMLFAALFTAKKPFHAFTPLLPPDTIPIQGFVSLSLMIPWAFVGFDSLSKVSDELDFPVKRLGRIMLIAVGCAGFAYIANIFTTLIGVPEEYASWPEYLASFSNAVGVKSYPIAVISKNAMGKMGTAVFFIATFSATLTGLLGFSTTLSHLVSRIAEYGLIAPSLSVRHPKLGTPSRAIWLVFFMALIMSLMRDSFDFIEEIASVGTSVGFLFCSLSALLCAVNKGQKKYIVTGAVGAVLSLLWIVFSFIPIKGFSVMLTAKAMFLLSVWVFLGIAVYSLNLRRRTQIDIDLDYAGKERRDRNA